MIGLLPKVYSVISGVSKALCQFWWIDYTVISSWCLIETSTKPRLTINMHIIQINGKKNEYGVYTFTDA